MRWLTLRLMLWLMGPCTAMAHALYTLDNGMQVWVRPDHSTSAAAYAVVYRAGSADETAGRTGLAHLLEHLMFHGTPEHPGPAYSRFIRRAGGTENAATYEDATFYFASLPASALSHALMLESSRMRALDLHEASFQRERHVVMEERRLRVEDVPWAALMEQLTATAHLAVPYQHPVVGWMHDLEHLALDDALAWHRTWYTPHQAVLIVVGDVQPESVHRMAIEHFGAIPPQTTMPQRALSEPEPTGPKHLVVHHPAAQTPAVAVTYPVPSWHGPAPTSADPHSAHALTAWAHWMGGNDSGVLVRQLIREAGLATDVSVSYEPFSRHDRLWTVLAAPTQGTPPERLIEAIQAALHTPMTSKDLAQVVRQLRAEHVLQQDGVLGPLYHWITLAASGLGPEQETVFLDTLARLSPEMMHTAADTWLTPRRATTAVLYKADPP